MLRFLNATVGVPVTPGGVPNFVVKAVTKTPGSNEDASNYSRFNSASAEKSYPVYFGGGGGLVIIVADADATATVTVNGGYIPDTTAGGSVIGTVTNPKLAVTASQHVVIPAGFDYVWISHAGISAGGPVRGMYADVRLAGNA